MLFELNGNIPYDVKEDYYELNKINNILDKVDNTVMNNEQIDLNNGFYLGNAFIDTYKSYKNYRPKKIDTYTEEQKILLHIYELDFILNDLNLYLDIYPDDKNIFDTFKTVARKLNDLKDIYYEKYQVLDLCKDLKNKYTWLNDPWPWDGGKNV